MAFHTALLADLRTDLITAAVPGDLISVMRGERLITGLALGVAGAPATHVLLEGNPSVPQVYAMNAFGNQIRAFHLSAGGRLLLDIADSEADVRRLRDYVGCLGLTREGLVLCASGGRNGWREEIQVYVSMSTFALLEPQHELLLGAQWLTNWSVSYQTATNSVVVVLQNPVWPEDVRGVR